jgi:hypothetical protein
MSTPKILSLAIAISVIGCGALAQSDFDPVVADQIAELQEQMGQLQKQNAEAQAKYQEDLLRLQQLQATQEQQRQNELRKKQSDEETAQRKKREDADRNLWPAKQPGVVALTAVGGQNAGEPAHYLSQAGGAAENDKEAAQKAEFTKAVEQSKAEMLRIYPDAGVDESALSKKIIEIADRMEAQGNPLVRQADAPLKIAQMAANELGISPKP